jgi:hypothetical protein
VSEKTAPGGVLSLGVSLKNDGYAGPINPRPVFVVLDDGAMKWRAQLNAVDPRRWYGGKSASFAAKLRVPASVAPGMHTLRLWLPDGAASLENRPEYALQFANTNVWDDKDGSNVLTTELVIDPAAGGDVDPNASDFSVLP